MINAVEGSECAQPVKPAIIIQPDACRVTILMAVHNGGTLLKEQLDSLAIQSHKNWNLLASDDGSHDQSRAVLTDFKTQMSNHAAVHCIDGPGLGPAQNFLHLLQQSPQHTDENNWLAFADQDDVWLPDRLERGIAALASCPQSRPALYCSRTWITDARLNKLHMSPPRPRPPGFANALVQNIAAGNTILLNPAAVRLVCQASRKVDAIVMHDWWCYLLVTAVGGHVFHDDTPSLLYRQHGTNHTGANDSWRARFRRVGKILSGEYRRWTTTNIQALQAATPTMTPPLTDCHQFQLARFSTLRNQNLFSRLRSLRRLGLYRQTRISTIALWVTAGLRRL